VDALVIDLFWFGDSIKGTLGNLLGVISGWRSSGYDLFGDVVKYRAEVEREADRLSQ
jgi:hypothetical protein